MVGNLCAYYTYRYVLIVYTVYIVKVLCVNTTEHDKQFSSIHIV